MKRITLCLLLLTLLYCGCAGKQNPPEIPTTPFEEIQAIPNLICHVTASDTDESRVLTGEIVYSLHRLVNTALALDNFNPNDPPSAPTDEAAVHIVFYVEDEESDTAETEENDRGYLATATAYYGSYTVYEGGYTRFSLSPLHSNGYEYPVDTRTYGLLRSCLTEPTLEELTDFTCTVTRSDTTWTVDGEDAKELYRYLSDNLKQTTPNLESIDGDSVSLVFRTKDLEGMAGEYGHYFLYENGYIVFSPSLYVSVVYYYEIHESVYGEIMTRLSAMSPTETNP